MITILKNFSDNEKNFEYTCLCSTFSVIRGHNKYLKSYVDNINHEYLECKNKHVRHDSINHRYSLNSINLRSDELVPVTKGTHILFGGCSQTWGHEIDREEDLWSSIVNNNFEDSSGYYNIARGGWNTSQIVADAIAYCNAFGMPKYMFLLFPEMHREIVTLFVDEKKAKKANGLEHDYFRLLQEQNIFLSLMAIENFCVANNITLRYSTWHAETSYRYNKWKLKNFIPLFDIKNPDDFFYSKLKDDGHWTEKHNKQFAKIILESLK